MGNEDWGDQLPIRDHGLLADGMTAALVGRNGSVGWLCVPRFDSPSIVATLLDKRGRGGVLRWAPPDPPKRADGAGATPAVAPAAGGCGEQRYIENSNVLVTEFRTAGGRVAVTDWMPARFDGATAPGFGDGALCRWAEVLEGEVTLELVCRPRPEYGAQAASWRQSGSSAGQPEASPSRPLPMWTSEAASDQGARLWAAASFPLQPDGTGGLGAACKLHAGESAWFVLAWGSQPEGLDSQRVHASLDSTTGRWQAWAAKAQYTGRYREAVVRSALALKALIYAPTGALVAAPTASLPEAVGGPRNWDYRYCWPRDATFALYGLSLLGYHEEAGRFLEFIAQVCDQHPPPLQVCYRVDGSTDVTEVEIPGLSGFRDSRPVRIGNGAALQRQLDIYGEVMDAAYTYAKWRNGLELDRWRSLGKLVDYVAAHWQEPDESIWETRGGRQQFVYSKVLCWVALDRGVKIASRHKLPAPIAEWSRVRDEIHRTVLECGYNHERHSFTQTFTNQVLDSSLLLLPLVRFLSPHEPRMESTIRRVQEALSTNSMVARYENLDADGVGGPEGAFSICTFWLVDCLTLLGRSDESRGLFERMLTHANHLGLFSEEIDPSSGHFLGNFPQGFTHMALLNSAHNLELYPGGVK